MMKHPHPELALGLPLDEIQAPQQTWVCGRTLPLRWKSQKEFRRRQRSEMNPRVGLERRQIAGRCPDFCFRKEASFTRVGRKSLTTMKQAASVGR